MAEQATPLRAATKHLHDRPSLAARGLESLRRDEGAGEAMHLIPRGKGAG